MRNWTQDALGGRMRSHLVRLAVGVALVTSTLAVNHRVAGASLQNGVSIGDASVVEGDTSSRELYFAVTLPYAATQQVVVTWTTTPVTATMGRAKDPGVDFGGRMSGTLTFNPLRSGFTPLWKRITLQSYGDENPEPDETLLVTISVVSGPFGVGRGVGTGTIIDDDPAPPECAGFAYTDVCPTLGVSVGDASVVEGQSGFVNVSVIITLSRPPWDAFVRVPFTITGVGGAVPYVKKVAGGDFTWGNRVNGIPIGGQAYALSGTALFGDHQPDHFINFKIFGDQIADPGKGVLISLGTPTVVFGAAKTLTLVKPLGLLTIIDND